MSSLLALALLDGLVYGSLLFLVAVGLTLVFGVLRILNIAHGSFYALGAYLGVVLGLAAAQALGSPWFSYPALLLAAILVGGFFGPVVERFILRWAYDRPEALQLLITFSLFLILEDVQKLLFGVQPYFLDMPFRLLGTVELGGVPYAWYQLLLILVATLVLLSLRVLLRGTPLGKILMAVVADREMAQALGVDARRIYLIAFSLGTGLAALGGALASPTVTIAPGLGAEAIVLSFAVVAVGGLGQIEGAAIGALLIGLGRSLAVYLLPELDVVVPYLVMVLVLLFRPVGIFGSVEVRRI
ncbi:branched-chain amino acid ABC transporter permease [Thermus thermophilus]|uniref:branched-chain amino acid ABC transporter permease n=1 Tax=Thermus thermophilus TaxID=274 RepID=UPI001C762030|nr:branched-chain amino acid ABC transporter permease [Thermus thermophilus]BCZ90678.1 branched-chain amino acid ABC transporter permease [Thermus thermophilus]